VLNLEDLHSLSKELSSEDLRGAFKLAWIQQHNKSSRYAIYKVIWKVLRSDILFPVIPRLIYMATTLAQPFLITAMIKFIENSNQPGTNSDGYALIAAFGLDYSLMAICNSWYVSALVCLDSASLTRIPRYSQSMARFSTKLRSGLVSLIYNHTLNIHPEDADLGAGTVVMNIDVEKVMIGSAFLHDFWTLMVSCGIALYILYTQLGVTFVVPTVTSIVMAVICFQIGKRMKPRQSDWTAATQKRVTAISYATGCMKAIRMLGLTSTVHDDLTQLRKQEVDKNQ
jgi:ATP-binding cassette, subfamily C (CFTR/MRP), member 1